jgi:MYXO-CTERM domain-containing protein
MLGGSWGDGVRRAALALGMTLAVAGAGHGILATSAAAQDEFASVIVDSTTPELVEADGGGWTVDVVLTNITKQELTLTSQPDDLTDTGCIPRVPATLAPAQRSPITVKVPADCKLSGGRFDFEIDAETPSDPIVASILFKASPGDDDSGSSVPWIAVVPIALLVLLGGFALVRRQRAEGDVTART